MLKPQVRLNKVILFSSLYFSLNSFASDSVSIIKYVGSRNYPPLEWIDDNNNVHGFLPEVVKQFERNSNTVTSVKLQNWIDAQNSILNGDSNLIAMIGADYRREFYEFSDPIYYVSHAIYTLKGSERYTTLNELNGKTVAIVKGSYAEHKVREYPKLFPLVVETELQCLTYVVNKVVDACIEVTVSSNYLSELHNLPVEMSSLPFWNNPYVFAVKKNNIEIINQVNSRLRDIVADGSYSEIVDKWESDFKWYSLSFWEKYGFWVTIVSFLLFVFLFALAMNGMLKKKVIKRTCELKKELMLTKTLKSQLARSAKYDEQTELLNRNGFTVRMKRKSTLERYFRNESSLFGYVYFAVQITNVDTLISLMGYTYVLSVIKHVGHKIKEFGNVDIAHLGRGVFIVSSSNLDKLNEILDYILGLRYPLFDLEPDISIGYVSLDNEEAKKDMTNTDIDEIIRKAITALSYAKKKQVSVCEYDENTEPNSLNEKLLTDFRIHQCKDFLLHYQPQVCLKTNKVIGYEALLRWNHPELGILSPNMFIPLFEKANNMYEISTWVLREVVEFVNKINDSRIKVSINITAEDIINDKFLVCVKEILPKIDPSQLIFEVTESSVLSSFDIAKNNMEYLNQLGVSFSVDDFGTGYSTLAYLNELPVKEVKLDRSFTSKIHSSYKSRIITESIIGLAHELGLEVVAEGIEDKKTIEYLADFGCERGQGYYYSKPVNAEEISVFTRKYNMNN
ncbi:EAL domain-containing protein [Vibrio sp. sp1]|uniref:EAL domain-containing protein n=1 Tax=Vibrio sp. sp1 TaxID=2766781 RepID=UPI00196391C2|nr:EAL domain-containing protein [Vibrio sp. sp1]QRZ23945.1 EAL domain-containing protein [Vibrio sp. sp1]GHY29792.1 GGDEF domain-containing protein [Vibrio cholerae]